MLCCCLPREVINKNINMARTLKRFNLINMFKPSRILIGIWRKNYRSTVIGTETDQLGKVVDLSPEDCFQMPKLTKPFNKDMKNEQLNLNYKKLTNDSKILSGYLVNVKSKKKREKSGLILLEGKRLIQDAVDAGCVPHAVFFSRFSDVANMKFNESVQLYHTKYKDLQLWGDVATSQGIIGIFPTPDTRHIGTSNLPLTIICDSVRDPGNLGSILRTASAVGCSQLILTVGCVDLWEPKVVRSGAGAHFRLTIHRNIHWENMNNILPDPGSVHLADSDVIPHFPAEDDTPAVYELNDEGMKVPIIKEPLKRITDFQRRDKNQDVLPLKSYIETDFSTSEALCLVIGGETEGLSSSAYDFAKQFNGSRVFIPLENGVESLNSGTALGVLAYEIRRQRVKE